MGLKNIDNAAASKGKGVETLWQFIKFIVVSLAAFVIQIFLPLIIKLPMKEEFLHRAYEFWIFKNDAPDENGIIVAGLGVFIAANLANVIAQIVSFFINRDKTFNSDANIAITLPIYIVFTIALICFSAWLSPTLIHFFETKWNFAENVAISVSGAVCGAIQFFLYFPFDKILFPKKKEAEEVKEVAEESVSEVE